MTTTKKKTTTRKKASTPKKVTAQKIPDLPTNPFVFEVFDAASKMRSKAKKIEVLQRYKHPSVMAVCIWNFDDSVISLLPQGEVPYGSNIEDETTTGTLSEKIEDAVSKMSELRTTSLGSQDQGKASIRKEYQKFYNFKNWKTSASFLYSTLASFECLPFFSITLVVLLNCFLRLVIRF